MALELKLTPETSVSSRILFTFTTESVSVALFAADITMSAPVLAAFTAATAVSRTSPTKAEVVISTTVV